MTLSRPYEIRSKEDPNNPSRHRGPSSKAKLLPHEPHRYLSQATEPGPKLPPAEADALMGQTWTSAIACYRTLTALTAILLIFAAACSGTQTTPAREARPADESSVTSEDIKKALDLTPWTTNILFAMDVKELRAGRGDRPGNLPATAGKHTSTAGDAGS